MQKRICFEALRRAAADAQRVQRQCTRCRPAIIDADELRTTPVPHRYIHGVILDDAEFQILSTVAWNRRVIAHSYARFFRNQLSTGSPPPGARSPRATLSRRREGWNRLTIVNQPEDTYYESRRRIRWSSRSVCPDTPHGPLREGWSRTLIMGGSNGGHHTKWMVEGFPDVYDGGIAGYGFNCQVSQWGSIATVLRHYDVIASRIDDIIAKRIADPTWDPFPTALSPPLTVAQLAAFRNIYDIPARLRQRLSTTTSAAGRAEEAQWKEPDTNALLGYLRDSMPAIR